MKVKTVKHYSKRTEVVLEDGRKLDLPPFCYVREGDSLAIYPSVSKPKQIKKLLSNGYRAKKPASVTLLPSYHATETIILPPHNFKIAFRQRTSERDWQQARRLEQFHYRGQGLNKIVGRRSVLLAVERTRGIVAYGVVCSTVPFARPRFQLLETNFREQMRTKLINQIVRIPRIVVHPEFRGMGLGVLMARHLVRYVRKHWDVTGYPPVLVEVIAAMTDYHRFFEEAGFVRVGDTGGYRGIGSQPRYGNGAFEARDNTDKYKFLKDQNAKPYLVYPLTSKMRHLIHKKVSASKTRLPLARPAIRLHKPVILKNISLSYRAKNGLTQRGAIVKEAFGVDSSQMSAQVLNKFALTITPGDTVLLTGASGSGKSTIIRLLTENQKELRSNSLISGHVLGFQGYRRRDLIAELSNHFNDARPLIDQLGRSPAEAIELLNGVGLAEAHLYLKRPNQISEGQKYRFAVALLCNSKKPIWIADEFASTLDSETAAIVAKGLRKTAYQNGATLVVAAAHIDAFVDSLLPNTLVRLSWGDILESWSIKLNVDIGKTHVRLRVANKSTRAIHKVQIGSVDESGMFKQISRIQSISSKSTSAWKKVPFTELQKSKAIIARCPYKVADIVYIRSA